MSHRGLAPGELNGATFARHCRCEGPFNVLRRLVLPVPPPFLLSAPCCSLFPSLVVQALEDGKATVKGGGRPSHLPGELADLLRRQQRDAIAAQEHEADA